jgi:hypothetical protein
MEHWRIDPTESGPGSVWDHARREYLSGVKAATICQRYGVSLASFRAHARAGGWRRIDRADCDIPPEPGEYHPADDVSFADLADQAFLNIRRAIGSGRAAEASSWMRLFDKLADRARAEVLSDLPDYPPPESSPEPEPAREPLFLTRIEELETSLDSSSVEAKSNSGSQNLDSLDPVFFESSPAPETASPDLGGLSSDPLAEVQRNALLLLRSRRLEHGLGVSDLDQQLEALGPGP